METPGIGIGGVPLLHMHNGDAGFFVSRFFGAEPLPIFIPVGGVPIEIGNKQLQQTSVIGLTKRPLHVKLALLEIGIKIAIIKIAICLFLESRKSISKQLPPRFSCLLTDFPRSCFIFYPFSPINNSLPRLAQRSLTSGLSPITRLQSSSIP